MRRRTMGVNRQPLYRGLIVLFLVGAGVVLLLSRPSATNETVQAWCLDASLLMQQATQAVADYRTAHGPPIDPTSDINKTGLIGAFFSPMTTTVGNLEAKRTSTDPNMAGLLVVLLNQAGVRPGDFIAVGASGSFPALTLATLCAAKAMNVKVGLIVSLGASQWGANLLDLTWIDLESLLTEQGLINVRAAALSIGGDHDIGRDLDPDVRDTLRERIVASGYHLIWN
jgi:poly-gamma-glutamate system protein